MMSVSSVLGRYGEVIDDAPRRKSVWSLLLPAASSERRVCCVYDPIASSILDSVAMKLVTR